MLISFKDMLWSNLTYTYSWGEWRYTLAFALMLIICLVLPWVKEKLKPLGEHVLNIFLTLLSEEETTSSSVEDYLYYKNALVSWCLNMSKTPEAKDELMQYVFGSDDPFLYELLLTYFSDQMTSDEYNTVIKKRDSCFTVQSLQSSEEKEVSDENL